ncbi:MAG: hypothetical protein E7137_06855 [Rikenellaceae bacterium]|nr:hypothetical protein [Rikenellaceae bacterium]
MRIGSKITVVVWMALMFAACRELPSYFQGNEPLARVNGHTLYLHEVERSAPEGISGDDSAAFYRLFIDRWVNRRLKLTEAERLFSASESDIEAMVEEYRQSLLIRKLDQYYVDNGIDTLFTDEAIQSYYNTHLEDFKSDRTLVKGRILRFPEGDRRTKQLLQLMQATRPESRQDLSDICQKNHFDLLEFSSWVDYEEFLSHLPTLRHDDHSSLLAQSGVQQMRDSRSRYYFQLTAVRRSGEALPLEQVTETIRRILFNQRHQELLRCHEEELRLKAEGENRIRLFFEEESPQPQNQE